eukprot:Plantae.Rhodophyta-Hildenbrandia_rubra.ctg7152.p1 GENE.Plantae.Rhodophyta-Hildenbrandia_rubra.ctg7152~~Plantae.Rhodophyta-Hildenbrandia_rubra.ctg7152.p1  ORF type:complete len:556 (+),score=92.65 Plantae.Rhodophyta-Hildenbrandia_rubra.ctg7152:681-2348(+)
MTRKKLQLAFPAARIKRMMQSDEDIGKIATHTPALVAKALEGIVEDIVLSAAKVAGDKNARVITPQHLKKAVESVDDFDFLRSTFEKVPAVEEVDEYGGNNIAGPAPKFTDDQVGKKRERKVFASGGGGSNVAGPAPKIIRDGQVDAKREGCDIVGEQEPDIQPTISSRATQRAKRPRVPVVSPKMKNTGLIPPSPRPRKSPSVSPKPPKPTKPNTKATARKKAPAPRKSKPTPRKATPIPRKSTPMPRKGPSPPKTTPRKAPLRLTPSPRKAVKKSKKATTKKTSSKTRVAAQPRASRVNVAPHASSPPHYSSAPLTQHGLVSTPQALPRAVTNHGPRASSSHSQYMNMASNTVAQNLTSQYRVTTSVPRARMNMSRMQMIFPPTPTSAAAIPVNATPRPINTNPMMMSSLPVNSVPTSYMQMTMGGPMTPVNTERLSPQYKLPSPDELIAGTLPPLTPTHYVPRGCVSLACQEPRAPMPTMPRRSPSEIPPDQRLPSAEELLRGHRVAFANRANYYASQAPNTSTPQNTSSMPGGRNGSGPQVNHKDQYRPWG